jgi:hypothetical protein
VHGDGVVVVEVGEVRGEGVVGDLGVEEDAVHVVDADEAVSLAATSADASGSDASFPSPATYSYPTSYPTYSYPTSYPTSSSSSSAATSATAVRFARGRAHRGAPPRRASGAAVRP